MIKKFICAILVLSPIIAFSQTISLEDLSAFRTEKQNWSIVGDVIASLGEKNQMTADEGTGVLLCKHEPIGEYGEEFDLFTKDEYGDIDLSLEFMMARGSNSGIYLQSRYEIQLNDSWGVKNPKFYDCGGIYQRRDLSKPDGQNQYEGYAPRYNTYKAPGLWNKIDISYKAPKFDKNGKKISNATIIYIRLNGILIHENVEMSGPTGGTISEEEVAMAPLRFQGDHGTVAFRNIEIKNYDKTPGNISDLKYRVYYGIYPSNADLSKTKIDDQGETDILSWEVTQETNNYVYYISGVYHAPTDGNYTFELHNPGNSSLTIDGKEILDDQWTGGGNRVATTYLTAGKHNFEIFSNKRDGWLKPALGLWSQGPGFRLTPHHAAQSVITSAPTNPIILAANNNTTLRSFMDWRKGEQAHRIVHAISVGSPDGIHYTYDADKGSIAKVWRGDFLDTTPMWHDRGDGSSLPLGSVTVLYDDFVVVPADDITSSSNFKPLGYQYDNEELPTFRYSVNGNEVSDKIRSVEGKYFERELKIKGSDNLVARLIKADKIEQVDSGLYAIDGKSFYIKADEPQRLVLVNGNELIAIPENGTVKYSIIF